MNIYGRLQYTRNARRHGTNNGGQNEEHHKPRSIKPNHSLVAKWNRRMLEQIGVVLLGFIQENWVHPEAN